MKGHLLQLFGAIRWRLPLPLGAVHNKRSLVYSGNVVRAIDAVLDASGGAHETFFVSDDDDVSTSELIRRMGAAVDRPARLISVPPRVLEWIGAVAQPIAKPLHLPVSRGAIARLTESLQVDITKLRSRTRYEPLSMQHGLAETARWYLGPADPA